MPVVGERPSQSSDSCYGTVLCRQRPGLQERVCVSRTNLLCCPVLPPAPQFPSPSHTSSTHRNIRWLLNFTAKQASVRFGAPLSASVPQPPSSLGADADGSLFLVLRSPDSLWATWGRQNEEQVSKSPNRSAM